MRVRFIGLLRSRMCGRVVGKDEISKNYGMLRFSKDKEDRSRVYKV